MWTLNGGTPMFGQGLSAATPTVSDMLGLMGAGLGLGGGSLFSPTPRHSMGGVLSFCPTPLHHHSFPTPTAQEIKKIDQGLTEEPLFGDSFFHMDASTLASLNGLSSSGVLSPIFRVSGLPEHA